MERATVEGSAEECVDFHWAGRGVAEVNAVMGQHDGRARGELKAEAAGELGHSTVREVVEEFGEHGGVERAARKVVGEAGEVDLGAGVVAQTTPRELHRARCAVGGEEAQGAPPEMDAVAAIAGREFEEAARDVREGPEDGLALHPFVAGRQRAPWVRIRRKGRVEVGKRGRGGEKRRVQSVKLSTGAVKRLNVGASMVKPSGASGRPSTCVL